MDTLNLEAGFNYLEENRVELAKKIFEDALMKNFKADAAYFGLGCCSALNHAPGEAMEYFKKSIEALPSAQAYYNLGAICMDNSPTEAEGYFKNAIRLEQDHYNAHVNLGLLLKRLGRMNEAKDNYEKAIEIDPEDLWATSI